MPTYAAELQEGHAGRLGRASPMGLLARIRIAVLALLAVACGSIAAKKSSPILPLSSRPIVFVGSLREVSLIPKPVDFSLDCASDAREGLGLLRPRDPMVMSNSCGCEHAAFTVSQWITPQSRNAPAVVTLGFGSSEWCRPITPITSTPLLVVWDDARGEPEMRALWELHPAKWFFAPSSTKLARIELGPLLVDEPIPTQWEVGDESDKASLQMIIDLGACKRGASWVQCRSVPLDAFIMAIRTSSSTLRRP